MGIHVYRAISSKKTEHFFRVVDVTKLYAKFITALLQIFRFPKPFLMVYGYTGIQSFFLRKMEHFSGLIDSK